MKKLFNLVKRLFSWFFRMFSSSMILALLVFIVINFYIFASVVNIDSFFYVFLLLSVAIDGLHIFLHLPRRYRSHENVSFDPSKLTVLISCYNGQDVIGETIQGALKHVPADQIIVISDASTDDTARVAQSYGVRVYENKKNMQKAFTISIGVQAVKTPYVLVMDDDTLIGDTFIPTSLLDEGYTAVAFNVMPLKEDSLLNALQIFEYRKSMQIGKNLRSRAGAIGNVSGAIGLFRTEDLVKQITYHSGQFGGEDEQRTMLAFLQNKGKGVTYTDSTVLTKSPQTFRQLFKRRAFSWNLSIPELFVMYWRILFHPDLHYLLKAEKSYALYIYLTDPLRVLFLWLLVTEPQRLLAAYGFYLALSLLVWFKTKVEDPFWVVLLFPLYNLLTSICRFFAHFHWFEMKMRYIFKQKHHRYVKDRRLLLEYSFVTAVMAVFWTVAIMNFTSNMSLADKIRTNRLDDIEPGSYEYEPPEPQPAAQPASQPQVLSDEKFIEVSFAKGETPMVVAEKVYVVWLQDYKDLQIPEDKKIKIITALANKLPLAGGDGTAPALKVDRGSAEQIILQELAR